MILRITSAAVLCSAALAATGCAGGLGSKRYACEGLPSRPLCLSTAEIYALTEHDGPPPAELPAAKAKRR